MFIDVTPSDNYLEKITEIYAFVSSDENGEGVIGMTMPTDAGETFMPFVCADKAKLEKYKFLAKMIGKHSSKTIKLIKLTNREEIEVYERPDQV